jgi:bla regulator protein blaR1
MNGILNHLWQSSLFSVAAAIATVPLRRNAPRLRYWVWFAASLKFLVPFSLLVSLGSQIKLAPDAPSLHAVTVQQISGYFAPGLMLPPPATTPAPIPWNLIATAIWSLGSLLLLSRWFRRWALIHVAARQAARLDLYNGVPVLASPSMMEPGAFGVFRPVILLPSGLSDRLTPPQRESILVHEARHIRCYDNLTAALHMCVETLFWFHPLVWWIGSRLMDERERDCDQAVLAHGSRPSEYARAIVNVCAAYSESPLPCASGISGSDLKRRIREIMIWRISRPMTHHGKALLAAAALLTASVPFVIGVIRAQTLPPPPAYTYDEVSIHRSDPSATNVHIGPGPHGGLRTVNTSVLILLSVAYAVQQYQIAGAPGWVSSDHFDITFTPDKEEAALSEGMAPKDIQASLGRNRQRLQAVLRDRFGLVLRAETRQLPVYVLTQARQGNKLSLHADPKSQFPSIQTNGRSRITASNATMEMLAQQLGMELGRPVHDETHLDGRYDLKLDWTPDLNPTTNPDPAERESPPTGASLFTAITEQLGLRLESKTGPVQVFAVEKINRPAEN